MSDAQIFKKPFACMESGHIVNQLTYLKDEKVKEDAKENAKEDAKENAKEDAKEDAKEEVKEEVKEPVANALEILPINFIREEWVICPGCCGEIDNDNDRCIIKITKCGDIMHQSCFNEFNNHSDKTCCPCTAW